MKVVEDKVHMYENVLLIDVGKTVVQYSGTGITGVMTGRVRFHVCAKEEREVMELLEAMGTRRR